ncbi:hypothetical protein [Pseudomonas sp. MWU12-2345]|uniref:hypothetical protein n=1 Tax=Pseudomonas sp. MWU12-2345 TaxID=2928689 RepID=UPI00200F8A99|nr:hypothetical protein [Pseudomonas sp. MWU12-2345]
MTGSNDSSEKAEVRGSLDYTFGVAGKVYLFDGTGIYLQPCATHILPDGKILCAAYSVQLQMTYLIRLDDRGVVDASFGSAGISRFKLSDFFPGMGLAQPYNVKFDVDRNKVVMGFFVGDGSNTGVTGLARFELNGNLDEDFGIDGVMIWSYEDTSNVPWAAVSPDEEAIRNAGSRSYHGAMALLDDGGVMILSTLHVGVFDVTFLTKVGNDGFLDKTFCEVGYKSISRNNRHVWAEDLLRQGDHFLVAVTSRFTGEGEWFIARYDADGNLDTHFATDGYYDGPPSVKNVILPRVSDAKLYFVGTSANTASQHLFIVLQRRGMDGQVDPLFGEQGWGGSVGGPNTADTVVWKAALYNPRSTVVVAGSVALASSGFSKVFIASIEQDMGWDGAFGNEGVVMFDGEAIINGLSVQPDGKIIFIYKVDESAAFALVRLHG